MVQPIAVDDVPVLFAAELFVCNRCKEAFVSSEAGRKQNRIFHSQECRDLLLELTVDRQCAAEKANGRDTETELTDSPYCGFFDPGVRRKPKIVVRSQHDDLFAGNAYYCALFGFDDGFLLEGLRLFQALKFCSNRFVKGHGLAFRMKNRELTSL